MSKNTIFSKEKECKCCHEWWFTNNIKQDLCPNCYDYFKQLKQQLAEKDKEKTQLAIHELEEVEKACFNQKELVDFGNVACFMVDVADILEIINNQLKELKGENK